MKLKTGWVNPPQSIGGLDHLGTQAPCVLIYGQLLPGITNVTDRARYYSLYPWLIWSYDLRYSKDDPVRFVEFFRRADCLFTLIAERHARTSDHDNERHGVAMVGRVQLVSALDKLVAGSVLVLSDFTSQESPTRYFKNSMGGLAQYYAGTLSDLGLMDGAARPWFMNTKEHGLPLAEKVDSFVPGDLFWKAVETNEVTLSDLDELAQFCACQIPQSHDECRTLTQIYFDSMNVYDDVGSNGGVPWHLSSSWLLRFPTDSTFASHCSGHVPMRAHCQMLSHGTYPKDFRPHGRTGRSTSETICCRLHVNQSSRCRYVNYNHRPQQKCVLSAQSRHFRPGYHRRRQFQR